MKTKNWPGTTLESSWNGNWSRAISVSWIDLMTFEDDDK